MCGDVVTWQKNDSGTFTYTCQECGFQAYAKVGSRAVKYALEEIAKFAGIHPKPAAPAPASPVHNNPPARAGGLLLG